MAPWSRNDVLVATGALVAILGIVLSFFVPEFRLRLGLQHSTRTPVGETQNQAKKTQNIFPRLELAPNATPNAASRHEATVAGASDAEDLTGVWSATYPGGPLNVDIRQTGNQVAAILLTGNGFVPAGEVTFHGRYDSNPFRAEQIRAQQNFTSPH
jgi:hypothetical protein